MFICYNFTNAIQDISGLYCVCVSFLKCTDNCSVIELFYRLIDILLIDITFNSFENNLLCSGKQY